MYLEEKSLESLPTALSTPAATKDPATDNTDDDPVIGPSHANLSFLKLSVSEEGDAHAAWEEWDAALQKFVGKSCVDSTTCSSAVCDTI